MLAQAEKALGMAEDRAAAMLNGNFARKTDLVEVTPLRATAAG